MSDHIMSALAIAISGVSLLVTYRNRKIRQAQDQEDES